MEHHHHHEDCDCEVNHSDGHGENCGRDEGCGVSRSDGHSEGCGCGSHHHHHGSHERHQHALSHEEAVKRGPFAKIVDGATVGSISFDIACQDDEETVQAQIACSLAQVSTAIEGQGGIVGHAKASLERRTMSKVSVIDGHTSIDINHYAVYAVDAAVISFMVAEDFVTKQLKEAFKAYLQ